MEMLLRLTAGILQRHSMTDRLYIDAETFSKPGHAIHTYEKNVLKYIKEQCK